jgi:hypothetical protein
VVTYERRSAMKLDEIWSILETLPAGGKCVKSNASKFLADACGASN